LAEDFWLSPDTHLLFSYKPSSGDVQGAEAEEVKNKLLDAAKEAGMTRGLTVTERPVFEHRRHRAKVGFDDTV
jgi:hypothetical protein